MLSERVGGSTARNWQRRSNRGTVSKLTHEKAVSRRRGFNAVRRSILLGNYNLNKLLVRVRYQFCQGAQREASRWSSLTETVLSERNLECHR